MMGEINAAHFRQSIGKNAIKPRFCTWTTDFKLGHRRHFDKADRIAHGFNFLANIFALFSPTPAILIFGFHTLWCKPVRHFPAIEAAPNGT
ncbi:hypothetical protein D9M68_902500 [compost metagenome]